MNLLQAGAQRIQLLHQVVAVAAPGDIVLHGNRIEAGAGDGLLAGVEHLVLVVLRDMHFALHHGDPGSLYAGAHAEDRAGDGHAAIGSGHEQVAVAPLGGLHDDAAANQMDSEIAGGLVGGKAGTLAQLHHRAIPQLQHGIGILGGAQLDAIRQILAGEQRANPRGGDFVERAVDGLDDGVAGARSELIDRDPDGQAGGGHHHGGCGPPYPVRHAARGLRGRHGNDAALVDLAAGHAFVEMVLEQGSAGRGQAPRAVFGNEGLEAGASADLVERRGGSDGIANHEARPNAGGGRFDYCGIGGFIANFRHGLLQGGDHRVRITGRVRIGGVKFGLYHATPPM
ncbi:hypothetical protein SBA6_1260013 [Candidatus Sulfopaludibacter sp. SbA6]|nr:hypothetical protein SBA6_1260013 [Candidatus Sulfopaludibacter sp. SbA6]